MMYVINANYGGFSIPDEVDAILHCGRYGYDYDGDCIRTEPVLIDWVHQHPYTDLALVDIPDNATDWELTEYDGWESIIAVVDGRIVHLETV